MQSILRFLLLVAVVCVGVSCQYLPGKTAFAVSMTGGVTFIQLGAIKCTLVSAGEQTPTYSPDRLYRCSGRQPLPGGRWASWRCETPDGTTFNSITIESRVFYLTNGTHFLLDAEGNGVKVTQSVE